MNFSYLLFVFYFLQLFPLLKKIYILIWMSDIEDSYILRHDTFSDSNLFFSLGVLGAFVCCPGIANVFSEQDWHDFWKSLFLICDHHLT